MYDDDLRRTLRECAERPSFQPLESEPMLSRGRRIRRRRRWSATVTAGLAVGAVAAGAMMLPDLGSARPDQAAAPMARLDATAEGDGALAPIDQREMLRRCREQWSAVAGRDVGPLAPGPSSRPISDLHGRSDGSGSGRAPAASGYRFLAGTVERVRDQRGTIYQCMVPGDSRPGTADLAEAARGTVPSSDADLLKRCSTMFWHDVRRWQVLARQVAPDVGASIAAMSPSGRYVLNCFVSVPQLRLDSHGGTLGKSKISGVQQPPESMSHYDLRKPDGTSILDPAIQTCGRPSVRCVGWLYFDTGRVPRDVVRLEARTTQGRTFDIPVRDGWYAAAFGSQSTGEFTAGGGTLRAFNAAGQDVGAVQFHPSPR